MKASRWGWSLFVGLGAWGMVLQSGCGMESQEPATLEPSKGGLMQAGTQPEARLVRGTGPASNLKVQREVGVQRALPTGFKYQRLQPEGLWKGFIKLVADGSQSEMSLDLRAKMGASLQPKRREIRRMKPSSGWSLFGTAHACGPYGQEVRLSASASWVAPSIDKKGALVGDIVTYDDFQYSAGFNLKDDRGALLSGSVFLDHKTQKIKLMGSVMLEKKTADGKVSYTNLGNFTLERIEAPTTLSK